MWIKFSVNSFVVYNIRIHIYIYIYFVIYHAELLGREYDYIYKEIKYDSYVIDYDVEDDSW